MALFLIAVAVLLSPVAAWASGDGGGNGLISAIGISIIAATALAFLAYLTKQPLLLAYIAAGVAIGPQFGFGWVHDKDDVRIIAHIGLILLLFMIGLELDLKKLKESGKSLITAGLLQFILCTALGLGFFTLLGFTRLGAPMSTGFFGVKVLWRLSTTCLFCCIMLSSTTIVVKLLYEKFESGTPGLPPSPWGPGLQDIWPWWC